MTETWFKNTFSSAWECTGLGFYNFSYISYTTFTSKTVSPSDSALFQKDTLLNNNIRQISMDMKERAKPVCNNALIISFVAARLSLSMSD